MQREACIAGYITYIQVDKNKVNDIFLNRGSKFYKGEYNLHTLQNKFDCLLKKNIRREELPSWVICSRPEASTWAFPGI